jgi:bis(5'-nucleosyl)-tetraphosphatase (symmetrical)
MTAHPTPPRPEDAAPSCAWIPADAPILFVGDIQGCAEPLARLLERARFDPARHRLVPLGDTINRGPDAAGVLRLLREVNAQPILGNHEHALLALDGPAPADSTAPANSKAPASGPAPATSPVPASGAAPAKSTAPLPSWTRGPRSAYEQLQAAGMWEDALAWLRTWPLWRRGPGWIAVHAGLHPSLAPERTEAEYLTTVRLCLADGALPPETLDENAAAAAGYLPWHGFYHGADTVLFGHWARQGLLWRERLRGLDTGCVYGRQLSGLWWPEDRLVQVDGAKA